MTTPRPLPPLALRDMSDRFRPVTGHCTKHFFERPLFTTTNAYSRPGGDGHVSRKLSFVGRSGAGRAGYTQPQRTGGIKAQSLVGDAPKFSARREKRLCLLDFFFV